MKQFLRTILFVFAALVLFVACSSPKERYVNDLAAFTEQVKAECDGYTSSERDVVIEQYKVFREQREMYQNEFTQDDLEVVDSCYRQLNVLLVKGYINEGVQELEGYMKEIQGLIEDLQE